MPASPERRVTTLLNIAQMAVVALGLLACTPPPRQISDHHPVPVEMAYPCAGEGGMPRFVENQEAALRITGLRATGAKCRS
jgi:hypothetical protein